MLARLKPMAMAVDAPTMMTRTWWFTCSFLLLSGSWIVINLVPFFGDLVGFVGTLFAGPIGLGIPCVLYFIDVRRRERKNLFLKGGSVNNDSSDILHPAFGRLQVPTAVELHQMAKLHSSTSFAKDEARASETRDPSTPTEAAVVVDLDTAVPVGSDLTGKPIYATASGFPLIEPNTVWQLPSYRPWRLARVVLGAVITWAAVYTVMGTISAVVLIARDSAGVGSPFAC